jgi:FkbM family methyltransferase
MAGGFFDRYRFSLARVVHRFDVPRHGCLHVGANFGQEADVYDELGFRHVVWVEGFMPYFQQLQGVIRGRANHRAVNLMVSDVAGETVTFRVASNTGSSTALSPTDTWQSTFRDLSLGESHTVVCDRLDNKLHADLDGEVRSSLQFLVLDVEGSELKALRSMGRLLDTVQYAFIEVSLRRLFRGGPLFRDIDRFMLQHSFERVYIRTSAASGDALYRRVPRVSGARRFSMGLSALAYQAASTARLTDFVVRVKNAVKWLVRRG